MRLPGSSVREVSEGILMHSLLRRSLYSVGIQFTCIFLGDYFCLRDTVSEATKNCSVSCPEVHLSLYKKFTFSGSSPFIFSR
jgi:hypothetical protein